MISLKEALEIHEMLLNEFGGKAGIRDKSILEAALKRPFTGLQEQEFYPSAEEKAAAVLESIVAGHPFLDGNKRTGYVLMRLFLIQNRFDIAASEEEKYELVIGVASGKIKFEGMVAWLKSHVIKL